MELNDFKLNEMLVHDNSKVNTAICEIGKQARRPTPMRRRN